MAETEKQVEALEKEAVAEASANPQADAPKKNAVAAEPSKLKNDAEDLGAPVVKPTDSNPDATKKVSQVSDVVSKSSQVAAEPSHLKKAKMEEADKEKSDKDDKAEAMHDKEDEKKKMMKAGTMMKAGYHKEESEESYDVKADVDALVGDSDLSEEFKEKAATIFEAAIKSKVKAETAKLEEEYAQKLEESQESFKSELTEKVDSYLNYVVEEWMKENEIAIERGIKGEIAEDFISGLKKLFEDHYIDVPDEKYDVLEAKEKELEEMKAKINEMTEKSIEDKKLIEGYTKDEIFESAVEGLADTEKEKMKSLVEDVAFENADAYSKKLATIKESYFGQAKAPESTENVDTVNQNSNDGNIVSDMSDSMSRYAAAISRGKSRDIYGN